MPPITDLPRSETFDVPGVEIFAEGLWNGDKYTERDIDDMIQTFNETKDKFRPFLKVGHEEDQKMLKRDDLPAAGFIENLRKEITDRGAVLVADFVGIPKKIAQLVRNGAYRKVSSEIFFNIKIVDKTFRRLLRGVALLGAEMPGVLSLKDILAQYAAKGVAETFSTDAEVREYEYSLKEEKEMDEMKKLQEQLAEKERRLSELDAELKKYKQADSDKIKALTDENAKLKSDVEGLQKKAEAIEAENKKFATEARHAEINAKLDKWVQAGTINPSQKPALFTILDKSIKTEKFSIDGKELSMDEIIENFVKAGNVKLNTNEGSEAGKRQDLDEDGEIRKYMADQKKEGRELSYKEALIELSSTKDKQGA